MLSRRAFSWYLVVGSCSLLGLERTAGAEDRLSFELYADKAGEFRWRLKAGNGETLATSADGYKAKGDAKSGIERIKKVSADPQTAKFEIYEDAKKEQRWRLVAKNGKTIAASSEGYKARADAEKAIQLVKDGAKDAEVTDRT